MHVLGFSQVFLLHYTTLELKSKILLEQGKSYNHSESLVQNGLFALVYRWFAKDWGFHMKSVLLSMPTKLANQSLKPIGVEKGIEFV